MIYLVEMSKGPSIRIDSDDLAKIRENIGESLISVKQGIINPSFMVSIIPTDESEVEVKQKVEMIDGKPTLTIGEERKKLANKMNVNNLQIQ